MNSTAAHAIAASMQDICRKPLMDVAGRKVGEVINAAGLSAVETMVLLADLFAGVVRTGPEGGQREVAIALFLDRHGLQVDRPHLVQFTLKPAARGNA